MANVPTLFSRGRAVDRAERAAAGTGCIMAVLLQEGQEADSTLTDRITLADVLAVSQNKEAAWLGGTQYLRKTWAGAAVTINSQPANDRIDLDVATDPEWLVAGAWATPQKIAKLGMCYAATTTAATNAIWPLIWLDWLVTADGNGIKYTLDAAGFYRT